MEKPGESAHCCPVCGLVLPFAPQRPPFDAPCPECGVSLWCSRRPGDGAVVIQLVPGKTPDVKDVDRVIRSLLSAGEPLRILVDLSRIEAVSCALVARLVVLNKRVRAASGTVVLCGLRPIVREEFDCLGLDRVFEISGGGGA